MECAMEIFFYRFIWLALHAVFLFAHTKSDRLIANKLLQFGMVINLTLLPHLFQPFRSSA